MDTRMDLYGIDDAITKLKWLAADSLEKAKTDYEGAYLNGVGDAMNECAEIATYNFNNHKGVIASLNEIYKAYLGDLDIYQPNNSNMNLVKNNNYIKGRIDAERQAWHIMDGIAGRTRAVTMQYLMKTKKFFKKVCRNCGQEFSTTSSVRILCDICRRKSKGGFIPQKTIRRNEKNEREAREKRFKEIGKEQHSTGMTYGQVVAMSMLDAQHMEMMAERERRRRKRVLEQKCVSQNSPADAGSVQ